MNYEFHKVIKFLNIYSKINKNWVLIASNYNKKDLKLLSNKYLFDEKKIVIKT